MPVRSPVPDVDIPPVDVATLFLGRGREHLARCRASDPGDEPALLVDASTGDALTFSALLRMAEAIATALAARGFTLDADSSSANGPGRVAAVYSPADIRFSAVHFGTLMAGGAYTVVDPAAGVADAARRLADVDAAVVFAAPALLPQLLEAIALAGMDVPPANIILIRESRPQHPCIDSLERVPDGTVLDRLARVGAGLAERVALIAYSSGTTGRPKGVMLTHRNIVAMWAMVGSYSLQGGPAGGGGEARGRKQRTTLSALSLWHIYGHCTLCYQPFYAGDRVVQLPRFGLAEYLDAIETHRVDHLNAVPSFLHGLLAGTRSCGEGRVALKAHPAHEFNIASVRSLVCGGAPLPPRLRRRFADYFGGIPVMTGFGQTETSSVIGGAAWRSPAPGAVGVLYPNSTAVVVDENGRETDAYGELCVAGPHVMRGYVGLGAGHLTSDGFLRTGDCARLDRDGNIYLRGRIADVIHTSAGPVYPVDIESALAEHPAVEDAAAVGSGPPGGARAAAFVVLSPPPDGDAPERLWSIERWLAQRLEIAVQCRDIPAIPKTPAGKVLRGLLRGRLDEHSPGAGAKSGAAGTRPA
ncbi:hypothetical protein LPJ61_003334 [Coemansia biformis]|uniref:Acetyl-CoA synthetase-like protein n=1 Tax=Coemansia biformis TaxID=1286918 RepID=A0A9W8CYQ5_9FUNG|nr:hypothetical protein LPJ61_003334 [Coemansia biformis]